MPDGWYPTEPIPVAKGDDELDVWVLSLVWYSTRDLSGVAVWNGRAPEAGPVGSAWMDHPMPITFHGAWAPA